MVCFAEENIAQIKDIYMEINKLISKKENIDTLVLMSTVDEVLDFLK